jgi:hypothetical protein
MSEFLRVTMEIDGVTVVDRLLKGIEDRARDLRPVWPLVYDAFHTIVAKAFDTEGGSTDEGTWAPLTKRTVQDRVRQGFGAGPILQRTGALKRALTLGVGAYARMTPSSFQVQIASEPESVASFPYHQRGTRKMPRRAMVSLTADQRTQLMHPVRLYLTGRT